MCPVDFAFQRIGGKYKCRVLWALSNGTLRYGELRRRLQDITPKMLTQVLRELEQDNLVERKVYYEIPPKVEYSLKGDGIDLVPFIEMVSIWGTKQMDKRGITAMYCSNRLT